MAEKSWSPHKIRAAAVAVVAAAAKYQRECQTPNELNVYEKEDDLDDLREAMTVKLNKRANDCEKLNDRKLLAKLSGGDVIAQELK